MGTATSAGEAEKNRDERASKDSPVATLGTGEKVPATGGLNDVGEPMVKDAEGKVSRAFLSVKRTVSGYLTLFRRRKRAFSSFHGARTGERAPRRTRNCVDGPYSSCRGRAVGLGEGKGCVAGFRA